MPIIAKRDFTDKVTGKEYKENDIIKTSKEREKEILNSPYNVAEETREVKGKEKTETEIETSVEE